MSMTEPDTLRATSERAHLAAKATSPVVSIHDVDLRTLEGDFHAMTTIEEAERRVGITRKADFRGLQQGEVIERYHRDDRWITAPQMWLLAVVVGGAMWVAFFKWLGWL